MNCVTLSTHYRLYAFPDYWSMRKFRDTLRNVAIAKEFKDLKEIEAKHYVHSMGDYAYRNYLRDDRSEPKASGLESLKTALQALYRLNGYSAKFIIVERLY